jgi:hypothetical protein
VPLGLGLHTSIDIPKGKFIASFYGTLKKLEASYKTSRYTIYISKDLVLDCTSHRYDGRCLALMANSPHNAYTSNLHRVSSNCEIVVYNQNAYLKSTKNIKKHDEILLNYGKQYILDNDISNSDNKNVRDYWNENKRWLIAYDDKNRTPRKICKVDQVMIDGRLTDIRRKVRILDVLCMGPMLENIRDNIANIFKTEEYQNIESKIWTGSSNVKIFN